MAENKITNRFVKTRIISARTLQISMGAPVLIKTKERNPRQIALKEFKEEVLPITAKVRKPRKLEI